MTEYLPLEGLKPISKVHSAREAMVLWDTHLREEYNYAQKELYEKVLSKRFSLTDFQEQELKLHKELAKKEPKKDGLTGAYQRAEFFTMIAIASEIGLNCRVVVMDLMNLKDHNINLGEPSGGNYALKVVADPALCLADKNSALFFRLGGDDFAFLEFSDMEGEFLNHDLGQELHDNLTRIDAEEYLSGIINNKPIVHAETGSQILLNQKLVDKLKTENPDLLAIIVPANIVSDTFSFGPDKIVNTRDGGHEFSEVAKMIEGSMEKIVQNKSNKIKKLTESNASGVDKLARK